MNWLDGMSPLAQAVVFATLVAAAIPAGALLAAIPNVCGNWLDHHLRHGVIAFGGGIILAAVALVLVPRGIELTPPVAAIAAFAAGGIVFCAIDAFIGRSGGTMGQFMAMLLDYIPETLAIGAFFASGQEAGALLALLIAAQNLPEGFNAFREMRQSAKIGTGLLLLLFVALVAIAPVTAFVGATVVADYASVLGVIMLFAAGGILYLTFEDIAPQSREAMRWTPALGAVAGFLVGILGEIAIG